MSYEMELRKDLSSVNTQALFVYLVTMTQKNTNNLNNIILDLMSRDFNTGRDITDNIDYTNAIKAILDAKNKAIIDINNATDIAINSKTTEIKQIATEAKDIAIEARQFATEAKQFATEAKKIAEEAKLLADTISSNQSSQYSILLGKIDEVYKLATDSELTATDAKQLATDAKQLATDAKQLVDTLSSNQDNNYTDLLSRIDYLFNSFYRTPSSIILQTYGNLPL
jgi:hypothetical protein